MSFSQLLTAQGDGIGFTGCIYLEQLSSHRVLLASFLISTSYCIVPSVKRFTSYMSKFRPFSLSSFPSRTRPLLPLPLLLAPRHVLATARAEAAVVSARVENFSPFGLQHETDLSSWSDRTGAGHRSRAGSASKSDALGCGSRAGQEFGGEGQVWHGLGAGKRHVLCHQGSGAVRG